MKKIISLALVAVLAVIVIPTFAAGPVYDDLPDMEGAEIVVAVENQYIPFQFVDSRSLDDQAIGFEYDVVNEVCARINCTPVYEITTFDLQLAGVASGEYDAAMNGLFLTDERAEIYDFSLPYTQAEAYLLVRKGEDRFSDFTDFAAKAVDQSLVIGVQNGSFGQFLVTPDAYNVAESQVVTYDEFGALLVALENGDIDTMVVDAFGGEFVSNTGDRFELIGPPVADPVPTGMIFTKGSDWAEPFNAALESMTNDGYLAYLTYKWSIDFVPLVED